MNTATDSLETKTPQTGGGYCLGQSPTDLVGTYGATPIAQQSSPGGSTATVTAGSTTSVYVNTTFKGVGFSSTAWTVNDLVTALKALGIIG